MDSGMRSFVGYMAKEAQIGRGGLIDPTAAVGLAKDVAFVPPPQPSWREQARYKLEQSGWLSPKIKNPQTGEVEWYQPPDAKRYAQEMARAMREKVTAGQEPGLTAAPGMYRRAGEMGRGAYTLNLPEAALQKMVRTGRMTEADYNQIVQAKQRLQGTPYGSGWSAVQEGAPQMLGAQKQVAQQGKQALGEWWGRNKNWAVPAGFAVGGLGLLGAALWGMRSRQGQQPGMASGQPGYPQQAPIGAWNWTEGWRGR